MADKHITDPDVIEQIRAALPVADYSKKGLKSSYDEQLMTRRTSGLAKGEMIRLCKIDISWTCKTFLLLVGADNGQSLELVRVYVSETYNSGNVSNYVHRTFINGNKLVEFYFKDGYLFLRRDANAVNGYMTIIGGLDAYYNMGVVSDVSSYTKLDT